MHPTLPALPFGRSLLELWPLDPAIRFLNHGSFGATPRVVLDAQAQWRLRMEREPVRFMVDELPAAIRSVAGRLAAWLGTRGERLALVFNATEAVNAILASVPWRPGDEIVVANHAYPAIRNAAAHVARTRGLRVVEARIPFPLKGPTEIVEAYAAALTPRSRMLVADHVFSPLALVAPVAEIVTLCRERGVPVLVDGAHAPGMLDLDLDRLGADWYVGNAHKWLYAPKGCGFLHASPAGAEHLHPAVISNPYGAGFPAEFDWVGTHDYTAWLALPRALQFFTELGVGRSRDYMTALAGSASAALAAALQVELPAPAGMFAAMVTLPLPAGCGTTREDGLRLRRRLLDEHSVEVPVIEIDRRLWLRISAQVYNEAADYAELAAAVGAVLRR